MEAERTFREEEGKRPDKKQRMETRRPRPRHYTQHTYREARPGLDLIQFRPVRVRLVHHGVSSHLVESNRLQRRNQNTMRPISRIVLWLLIYIALTVTPNLSSLFSRAAPHTSSPESHSLPEHVPTRTRQFQVTAKAQQLRSQ